MRKVTSIIRRGLLMLFMGMACVGIASAQYTIQTIPNEHIKDARQWVSNPDGILSLDAQTEINRLLKSVNDSLGVEVAVVVVNSIGTDEIKDFATRLFAHWGIGKSDKDNGLLVLLVGDQRKVTFETGYGMEGILPDITCKRIQEEIMLPYFRQGNYDGGMVAGARSVVQIIADPVNKDEVFSSLTSKRNALPNFFLIYLGLCVVVTIFVVLFTFRNLFSVGYSSRYEQCLSVRGAQRFCFILAIFFPLLWIWWLVLKSKMTSLREKPYICDCGSPMRKLSETEDDAHLSAAERVEEQVESVDYDVWLCPDCNKEKIFRYDAMHTGFQACPMCKARTYITSGSYVIVPATTMNMGAGVHRYSCKHCKFQKDINYIIPRIVLPPQGRGGGGGGFGGGGSFGGGRSGGGGATSGW